jgi:hypothetical protein
MTTDAQATTAGTELNQFSQRRVIVDRILRADRKVRESRRSDVDAGITIEGLRCDSFHYRPPISIDLDPSETELQ